MIVETFAKHEIAPDWCSLASTALRGLETIYAGAPGLPHTIRWNGERYLRAGANVRYALITLIGLAESRDVIEVKTEFTENLLDRILRIGPRSALSLGDHGLAMWARGLEPALWHGEPDLLSPPRILDQLRRDLMRLDSVELSWLLLGGQQALRAGVDQGVGGAICQLALEGLISLYRPHSRLFLRHRRAGLASRISARVSCFANQIYPLLALAEHASHTADRESALVARELAENLQNLQGPKGQWWWLYDSETGSVVEQYPVFSVHQDGMAPMALLTAADTLHRTYDSAVNQGLAWIDGANELGENLVQEQGLILRDIHRAGVGRLARALKAAAWCAAWRPRRSEDIPPRQLIINRECRPYHLGWVLYAAGRAARRQISQPVERELQQAEAVQC